MNNFLNRILTSKYNPVYRSGTIAISLMAIVIATGFYLLLFYRLGAPYESMVEINHQVFASAVRSVHRFASDLSVVMVVIHVLRMLYEKKNWGPRALAWITGVCLTLILFILGWTGFILVWDRHAQMLAQAGAEIVNLIPLFSGVLTRAVSGATPVGSSFFFLNLFIHMSLPLGMVFLLWLHTSSLTKPAWFLEKKYFIAMTLLLFAFGFLVQEPLASQANLLSLEHDFKLNWFFAFVIPMAKTLTPGGALLVMSGFFILMISIPFWLKPRKESIKSTHNQKACTGCGQCVLDCPFTAIAMGPRTEGEGSEQVAFVDTDACVGCGICAASCSQMAIGPEDKSIRLQMNAIKELKQRFSKDETLIVYCRQSEAGKAFLKKNQNRAVLPIECSGNFHVASASFALKHFEKVKIFGCPTEACVNRLGQKLLEERFLHQRDPQPPPNTDLSRVEIISEPPATKASSAILTFVFVALLFGTYFLSAFPFASKFDKSVLRVALRIPSQTVEECVSQTEKEMARLPIHMRQGRNCSKKSLNFHFQLQVDGQSKYESELAAAGLHGDKPMTIEKDFELEAGDHQIQIQLDPKMPTTEALQLKQSFEKKFNKGEALLLFYNISKKQFEVSAASLK